MSTQKYVIFECDTCKRSVEILSDGRRPDPVRCNITLKCSGKLSPIDKKSMKSYLFTPLVYGLRDFVPRGTLSEIIPRPTIQSNVSLLSGVGSVALAAETSSPVSLVLYKISPNFLQFKRYTYSTTGSVQSVSGPDNSVSPITLRFSNSNRIKVFVNGVEAPESSYDRTQINRIEFIPAIYDTTIIVDVIVYNDLSQEIAQSGTVSLTFSKLTQSPSNIEIMRRSSWGDFTKVDQKNVLFCSDLSLLSSNDSYGFSHFEVDGTTYDSSNVLILLGRPPYSYHDKELMSYINGSSFDETTLFTYGQSLDTGDFELTTNSALVTNTVSSLIPTDRVSPLMPSLNVSNSESEYNNINKFIIGPV